MRYTTKEKFVELCFLWKSYEQFVDVGQDLIEDRQESFFVGREKRVKQVAQLGQGVNVLKKTTFLWNGL